MSAALRSALVCAVYMMPGSLSAADTPQPVTAVPLNRERKLEALEKDMRLSWQVLAEHLGKRNNELDMRNATITSALTEQRLFATLQRFERECECLVRAFMNGDDARECATVEGQQRLHRETQQMLGTYMEHCPADALRTAQHIQADDDALASANAQRLSAEEAYTQALMTDENGQRLQLYPEERADNPSLTPESYLDLLAKRLKTPKDLAMFLRLFFKYEIDTDDTTQPLRKGTWSNNADYWQTPAETLARVENGKMLGDCDDHSLLCDALLTRMGKCPVTIYLPGGSGAHVTTIWLEKHNGRFTVHEMGTDGWYENGIQRLQAAFKAGEEPAINTETLHHDTVEEAVRAAVEHFRNTDLLLTNFDQRQPQIRLPIHRWKPGQHIHDRIEQIPMDAFISLLSPPEPEPMVTAGTVAPPPPPE